MAAKITKQNDKKQTKQEAKKAKKEADIKAVDGFDNIANAVCKKFGAGAMMRLGDSPIVDVPVFPTGSPKLDAALGIGGYPRGRVIEVYGPESAGKTTIALHAIAEAQRMGGSAAFIDAEHALDVGYGKKLGVDVDNLLVSQPDSGEQALEITDFIIATGAIDIVVIDSVAALVPAAELNGEMGEASMGSHARLMSQAMRKLTANIARNNTTVIFINQTRSKIGVVFGDPETTTGGNALKFYASIRLRISQAGKIKNGDDIVGNKVKIKVVKNKLAPPFKVIETEIIFGHGFNIEGEILDQATLLGIIEQKGAWFSYGEDRLGQGRFSVLELLHKDRSLYDRICSDIKIEEASEDEED